MAPILVDAAAVLIVEQIRYVRSHTRHTLQSVLARTRFLSGGPISAEQLKV